MSDLLYLDTARLGRMSPAAQRAERALVSLAAEEGNSAYFERFVRHGLGECPLAAEERYSGLGHWAGVGELKQSLRGLAGHRPDLPVLIAHRSALLMKLAARALCSSCRNVLVTDLGWPGYHDILAFYFPGTVLGVTGRGLAWVRLSGEAVSLFSTQPEQDRAVLAIAERQVKEIASETGMTAGGTIEIRVYPDVETFRNATGEPGWVAARTSGRRIHLQPAAVLRERGALDSTIRHELLHVFVEAQAARGLPVWFREGLVGYLEHPAGTSAVDVADTDLRQLEDATRARRAYAAATQKVAALVERHGAPAVLAWLKVGLPDVK